jgi:hypothetical protein
MENTDEKNLKCIQLRFYLPFQCIPFPNRQKLRVFCCCLFQQLQNILCVWLVVCKVLYLIQVLRFHFWIQNYITFYYNEWHQPIRHDSSCRCVLFGSFSFIRFSVISNSRLCTIDSKVHVWLIPYLTFYSGCKVRFRNLRTWQQRFPLRYLSLAECCFCKYWDTYS